MNDIVFISRKYCRGEAWCNRLLAYAKSFQNQGYNVELVFLVANEQSKDSSEDFRDLNIRYLSAFSDSDNAIKKIIVYTKAIISLLFAIEHNTIIITSDGGGMFLPFLFFRKNKNFTFTEITEHPEILGMIMNPSSIWHKIKNTILHYKVLINNSLLKANTGIFTISNSLSEYLIEHGIPQEKICRINMFVDSSRFEIMKEQKEPYIAYCGTISREKDGVDILLKAFSVFRQSASDYKLYLIGRFMNQKTEIEIKELISSLNLQDSVVITGMVPPSQIPVFLKNANILALSRPDNLQNRNGFPTKLGEYLATGNPVVVTSIGEIPDFLTDGVNAYLADPDDVESFSNALLRVVNDYIKAQQIGAEGKLLVSSCFSSDNQAKIALQFIASRMK